MKTKFIFSILIISASLITYGAIRYVEQQKEIPIENPTDDNSTITTTQKPPVTEYPKGIQDDLLKINTASSKQDNVKITNAYAITTTYSDNHQEYGDYSYIIMRKGKNIRYETPEIIRVQDDKYNLMVYADRKMILLFDPDQDLGIYMKQTLKAFNPDTALALSDKVEVIDSGENVKGYSFYYSFLPYKKLDIYFDPGTYLINKVVYYYDGDVESEDFDEDVVKREVVLKITYEKLPGNNHGIFNTGNYISKQNKDFVCTRAFTGYTVYNNMTK